MGKISEIEKRAQNYDARSEIEAVRMINENPNVIRVIPNPTPQLFMAAIEKDPDSIKGMQNVPEAMRLLAEAKRREIIDRL